MDPEQIPLRDLHLPEAIGLWPLAPGWWVTITSPGSKSNSWATCLSHSPKAPKCTGI